MLSRIVTWLFVASLIFTPIGLIGHMITDASWWYPATLCTMGYIVACAGYAMFGAYKTLTTQKENATDNKTSRPSQRWHKGSLLVSLGLAVFGLLCAITGMFGSTFLPFILSGISLLAGLSIALAGAQGLFRKLDETRNNKLNPKPKPEPKVVKKPTPPHERPGYQYSFDF